METSALLAVWRSEMNDTAVPYLWSDDEFVTYLDDAQKMFCRKTDGIADATSTEATQLAVVPDTQWYPLHESITQIRSAVRGDDGRDIAVLNQEDMPAKGMRFDGRTGPLSALIIGMEEGQVRAYPVPNETVTAQLTVFRLPLEDLADVDQPLEVPAKHHVHLLHWVKRQAYLKEDPETFNKSKAAEFEGRFLTYCADVQVEQRRRRHKTRVVQYGGL